MKKKIKKHFAYYFSLFIILFFGLILVFLSSPNVKMQEFVTLVTVFFYIVSGILHHYINHEINVKIMVEYILIGLLGLSIIFFVLMAMS